MDQEIDPLLLAWVAGFFDGEGSISFTLQIKKTHSKYWNVHPQCMICIHQHSRSRGVLEKIVSDLGMGVVEGKVDGYLRANGGRDRMCHIRMRGREESILFLETVLPYLRVKKSIAERGLEALYLWRGIGNRKLKSTSLSRRMSHEEAIDLAFRSVTLNGNPDGSRRSYGRTFEELRAQIDMAYAQDPKLNGSEPLPKNRLTIEKTCAFCGKVVMKSKRTEHYENHFCDIHCYHSWLKAGSRKSQRKMWRTPSPSLSELPVALQNPPLTR